jgi:hypothetical protein
MLRAQYIRMRLGGSPNLQESFPDRAKGMHRARYNRLREEHDRAAGDSLIMMAAWVDKLRERLED